MDRNSGGKQSCKGWLDSTIRVNRSSGNLKNDATEWPVAHGRVRRRGGRVAALMIVSSHGSRQKGRSLQLGSAQFVSVLWRRRVSAVCAVAAVVAAAAGVFAFATPRYDASNLILVGDDVSIKDDTPKDKTVGEDLLSIAVIAATDDVLREAANRVGFERLFLNWKDLLNRSESPGKGLPREGVSKNDTLLPALRNSLSVKPQAKTNLIAIEFSNPDPTVAAEFANAVADSVISREIELWRHPGAVDFYENQRSRFEKDINSAASSLANFVSAKSIYSVKQQQDLLLRRASDLEAALDSTKALLTERATQKLVLVEQLTQIKPATSSNLESNFLKFLFGGFASQGAKGSDTNLSGGPETLPLPLERVYRDGFTSLVSLNSELAGLDSLQSQQTDELNGINKALSDLAANAAEFNRLEKAVEIATNHAETFDRRSVDEQINRDLANAKMSNLRVVQSASVPFKPTFPSLRVLVPAGLIGSLLAGVAAALCAEIVAVNFKKPTRHSKSSVTEGVLEQQSSVI